MGQIIKNIEKIEPCNKEMRLTGAKIWRTDRVQKEIV